MSNAYLLRGGLQINFIFSAVGGQGSHFLVDALDRRYQVGLKPDNALWHTLEGARHDLDYGDQGTFFDRSCGYPISPSATLRNILPGYIDFVRSSPDRTVVLGMAAEFGLLSHWKVMNVVFLFRHPLFAYASWAAPERHGNLVSQLGGINSSMALNYYADRWRSSAEEYLRLRDSCNARLIRYEVARHDALALGLGWAYAGFDSLRRREGVLSTRAAAYLRQLLEPTFVEIYPTWA